MKKIIYLSIALVTLTLTSCRNQDDMSQLNDGNPNKDSKTSTLKSTANSTDYETFNSTSAQAPTQGDPTKPPQD